MHLLRQFRRLGLVGVPAAVVGGASLVHSAPVDPPARRPGATAAVEGRVVIARALSARRARFRIYAEPGTRAQPPAPDSAEQDERRNIVVYIERAPSGVAAAPVARPALRQRSERFVPHVLPVMRGTTVDFPNDDALFHNVFSLSRAKEFDLGRYPRGASRSATFDRPGAVQVFCHIHADMSAVVLVLDNPYYVVPDAEGRYSIAGLTPGDYTIVAWHERIRPITHRLHLEPGEPTRVDFTIPLPAADAARER